VATQSLLEELRRRHVYRVAAAYAVVGWLLIQVVTQIFPVFHLPDWTEQAVVLAILIGFPIALVLAWAFDATPHGIVATDAKADDGAANAPLRRRSRRAGVAVGAIGVLIAAIAGGAYWHFGRTGSRAMSVKAAASAHPAGSPDGAQRNPGMAVPDSADAAATSGPRAAAALVAAQAIPAKSIAVLPFENLSTDKGNAYFADGMQDLILTKLADIGDLKVISRTSTAKYASHPDDLKTIARQLGVATVLEGSVQKAGKQVLINVQLIDAKTDSHIWAQSYTRTLDNIFGVEGEVADKIADALKARLSPTESANVARVPTRNPAAFDDYLRGQHYDALTTAGDFKAIPKAIDAYRNATTEDPEFALAWANLSMAQMMLSYAGIDTSTATRQQAMDNAQRALALAPGLPQAHLALGYIYRIEFHEYDKAMAQFRIAREALPNNADVEEAIAYIEGIRGDAQAAIDGIQRAIILSPRDPNLALSLAQFWQMLGRYDEAMASARRILALAPDDPEGFDAIAWNMVLAHGDVDGALAELAKAPAGIGTSSSLVNARIKLLLLKRDYSSALRESNLLQPGGRFITPQRVAASKARVHQLAGDEAGAKALYTQALALAKKELSARPDIISTYWDVATAQAGLGDRKQAQQTIAMALTRSRRLGAMTYVCATQYHSAQIAARYGDAESAVEDLRSCLDGPYGNVVGVPLLKLDPVWDPIRHDPRFQALLTKYASDEPAPAATGASAVAGSRARP